jgi:ABC-type branched-subunit amino acid transport system substrate-binding protein
MNHKWLAAAAAASLGLAVAGSAGATTEPPGTEPAGTEAAGTEAAGTEAAGTEAAGTEAAGTEAAGTEAPLEFPDEIETDIGVTDDTITIGMLADQSGAFAPLVNEIVAAQQVYWEAVNRDGGIAGRQVELLIEDNAYDVPTHLEKYEILRDQVAIISQSTGSPHTSAIAQSLVDDDLVAIPLSWYSGWPDPEFGQNVFETYTTYCVESMNGIEWLHNNRDVQTVALVSFPGEYGGDGDAGARMAAEALGLEIVYDGAGQVTPPSADNPNPDWSGVTQQIVDANPDLVWTTINPTALATIMAGAVGQGFEGLWSGNSPSYSFKLLDTEAAPLLDEHYIASTYIVTWGTDVPGMQEVIDEMTAAEPDIPVSDVYILGWTEGMVTEEILTQAALNGDMTRAGIVAAANEVSVDFNGLAPPQTWAGEPNEFLVRESYIYDVTLDAFNVIPLGEGVGSTGWELLEGPYVSETAANYTYEGPCYEPTS